MPLVLLAAAAAMAPADRAQAAMCAIPSERAGADARVLQTELMVAALTCGQRNRYNGFVKKFQPQLVANGKALRRYFRRVHGGRGEARVTRFVTRLANEASARSLVDGTQAYCASVSSLFDEVMAIDPKDFQAFVARLPSAHSHGIESCPREAAR
jgi:hypothetical protein